MKYQVDSGAEKENSDAIKDSERELAEVSEALRSRLCAARVGLWHHGYDVSSISPFLDSDVDQRSTSTQIGSRWIDTPLADLKPLDEALAKRQAIRISAMETSGRLKELFADFELDSVWCGPLVLGGRLIGVVMIEPSSAVPDYLDSVTSELFMGAAAALAWFRANRAQAQAELFLSLVEISTDQSLASILARACEGLAHLLGVRRASVFLVDESVLVPRMSRFADGSVDAEAWEAFCHPKEPLALVEDVLRTKLPTVAEDPNSPLISGWWSTRFSTNAALGVPIRSDGNEILGVLLLDSARPRSFGQNHIRLASAAASQLGRILEQRKRIVEREQRLKAVAALGGLFRAGVDSSSVLQAADAVSHSAKQITGVDIVCTYLVDKSNLITEIVTVGAKQEQIDALRSRLVGKLASDSPVWQHAVMTTEPGPLLLSKIDQENDIRPGGMAEILGLRSLAAIPLMSSDGPLGVVVCGDTQNSRIWKTSESSLLSQLAFSATIVVDNARLRETERYMATHDELTGLINRRGFYDQLSRTLAHVQRSGETVAVMLADLDNFKQINDAFGHHQGDALLVAVAKRLQSSLREADIVARLGGDEFAIVLVINNLDGAQAAGERVVKALQVSLALDHNIINVQASIGVACYPDHGDDVHTLLQHADEAMYVAKGTNLSSTVYQSMAEPHLL